MSTMSMDKATQPTSALDEQPSQKKGTGKPADPSQSNSRRQIEPKKAVSPTHAGAHDMSSSGDEPDDEIVLGELKRRAQAKDRPRKRQKTSQDGWDSPAASSMANPWNFPSMMQSFSPYMPVPQFGFSYPHGFSQPQRQFMAQAHQQSQMPRHPSHYPPHLDLSHAFPTPTQPSGSVESDDDTFTGISDTFTHEEDGDIDSGSVAGTVYTGSHVSTQHAPREAPALTPDVNKHGGRQSKDPFAQVNDGAFASAARSALEDAEENKFSPAVSDGLAKLLDTLYRHTRDMKGGKELAAKYPPPGNVNQLEVQEMEKSLFTSDEIPKSLKVADMHMQFTQQAILASVVAWLPL